MRRADARGRVLTWEATTFAFVIVLLWVDELFDLPAMLLGAAPTPVNWAESLFESVAVLGLAAAALWRSRHLLARIRFLEGFLPACAFCKRIRRGDRWIPLEDFIVDHTEARLTHGLCPECLEREYGYAGAWGNGEEGEE